MITIDKIASDLFGFDETTSNDEMSTSLNYVDNLF